MATAEGPSLRLRVGGRVTRSGQALGRVITDPASARDERTLARLEHGTAFQPGVATLGGLRLRYTHPHSLAAQFRDIFSDASYGFESTKRAPRIIDCGANIGLATLYWKSRYPESRITAFEPDPALADIMRHNLATAGIDDVELVPAAVWTCATELAFAQQGAGGGHLGEGSLTVDTVRLADWLDEPVDFLKIDIEGAEVDVLADCADALVNVERLFVEFHSFGGRPQRLDQLMSVLAGASYRIYVRTERAPTRPYDESGDGHPMDMQLNIYARRDGGER